MVMIIFLKKDLVSISYLPFPKFLLSLKSIFFFPEIFPVWRRSLGKWVKFGRRILSHCNNERKWEALNILANWIDLFRRARKKLGSCVHLLVWPFGPFQTVIQLHQNWLLVSSLRFQPLPLGHLDLSYKESFFLLEIIPGSPVDTKIKGKTTKNSG